MRPAGSTSPAIITFTYGENTGTDPREGGIDFFALKTGETMIFMLIRFLLDNWLLRRR